jgi:hypothetical protein
MLALRWRSCFFSTLGKREGSDPQGESLRNDFVPGLQSVEKKWICWFVDMSTDFKSVDFSRKNKKSTDRQTSRQQISFSGTLYSESPSNLVYPISDEFILKVSRFLGILIRKSIWFCYRLGGAREVPLKVVFVILKYYLWNVIYTIPM